MDIVILKFGGTSVTTGEKRARIITLVKECLSKGEYPIVVVSAIGRAPSPYATDTLISLVSDSFREDNLRGMDLLMSCGETISSVIISSVLRNNGVNATPLTGFQAGIITDSTYSSANVIKYKDKLIKKLLKQRIVPVVTGFQGMDKDGFITTLGRGGSDTTAAVLGAFLNAKRVDIYTDVDGILTSDPNIDPNAKLIENLTYDKAYDMAINGAKVIHPKAILYVKEKGIPMYIKNVLKDEKGTLIN